MCLNKGLPKPRVLYDITAGEIQAVLKEVCPTAVVLFSDSVYRTTTLAELQRFLKDDKTNEYRYISEYHDCDNFSFQLMGSIHNVDWGALPFGIVWTGTPGGNHAVNCFVDDERVLWFVEPQSDSVFSLKEGWVPYLIII
jgi:hypothetical protein